ncbi:aldose epimerase family protein [Cellulomonas edaphi]|uniref:Aldose epimerase n=1 Tax=Cellulomonas edaphi TaxID=3053468 RepID=A0ABT7S4M0_9CELL|nr:aldose epimerase [Cellulomons edaphi]MDM7829972.1 aldose epimerase [Cellulomons edaphi]
MTLRNERWEVDVLPGVGASLAAGRIRTADGVWRDLLRPTPLASRGNPERCASFPMLPWSNRIRRGELPFGGHVWQLQRNGADGTAIHGAVRHSPWTVASLADDRVVLEMASSDQVGVNFPWHFRARIVYAVVDGSLTVTTTLQNTDVDPFPAGFGHHPYFQRVLAPVGERTAGPDPLLHVPAGHGYALDAGIATGAAGEVPARADYRSPRALGEAFVDDVLTDLTGATRLTYPGEEPVHVDLEADPDYGHLVVYVPRRRSYFAVEPVTHVNGGFALHAAGVEGTGVFVLQPGQARTAAFSVTVR